VTDPEPIACTLGEGDLRRRLDEIAALGAESLLGHEETGEGHVLRFRSDESTRRRLEKIVTAEAECCPFLELEIDERDQALLLALAAPGDGRAVADELARAFSASVDERPMGASRTGGYSKCRAN
jgi:hypothetical protein